MKNIREIIHRLRDISTIGIADIGGNAIAAVFWFFIASIVGVESYGHISYFIAISGIVSTISLIGASNMILVHVPKGIKVQVPIFVIASVFGIFSSIVLYFVFFKFELSIITVGFVIYNLAVSELLGLKLYKKYLRFVIAQKILMVILGISLYYLLGPGGVIFGVGISYLPYMIGIVKSIKKEKIDFSLVRTRTGFLVNSYVLDLSNAFIGSIDKIIVGPLFGFIVLGNFQLGIQFLSILYIIPNVCYKFLITQESGGNSTKNITKYVILAAVILSLLGMIVSPFVLPTLFPKFTETTKVLQIVSLAVVPNTLNLIILSRFLAREKIRIVLVGSVVFLSVQTSGIILLGNLYGVNGIAYAIVLAETVQLFYYFISLRLLKIAND